ncbi:piwi-like protein 3 [Pteropus vampyrus]|uniref:Piwi-like protein 3 n=1 Tax=Pteropus vampyrus TaxID=132908 RepID=A0A6P3R099_PTEVA|nr:piwi-like protein 3 [Pteropus vampyrus]
MRYPSGHLPGLSKGIHLGIRVSSSHLILGHHLQDSNERQGQDSGPGQSTWSDTPQTCYAWSRCSPWSRCSRELQLSAELQAATLKGRRAWCGGVFRDLVVNTRQYLEHVRGSKAGSQGKVVKLFANHFRVTSCPQWIAYKYNIDYMPDIENGDVRESLLFQHEALFGKCHIFDGNSLLLPCALPKSKTELVSHFKDQLVKVTIEFSSELTPTSPDRLRYYNILFRKILKIMKLRQVGRNYYNKEKAEEIRQHKLEIWPGYVTSILQYENSMTLCADVNHKLLRMETAYDLIMRIREDAKKKGIDVKEQVSKELVGSIVFTKFNNKTYRVDAINWKETPKTIFKKSDGTKITFMEYYKKMIYLFSRLEVSDTVNSYVTVLKKHDSSNTQMVVCVLSSDRKEMYDGIKKYLCVNCPIPSQCVVARTLDKPQTLMTIATKIAQQMNCKMGGALWKVQTGLQNAMFIGIDCFHDIVNRRKSIAGFVASVNEDLTEWFSQCIIQESGQELVNGLRACLQEALKLWYERNSLLPYSIIVYRDGVGDGQLQALIDYEIPQIVSSLKSIFNSQNFKLTFIVVKKRINTRFFVESQGRLQNPLPGTVVDVELTRREWYDFFIVSQSVKDGTVTPTHYNVIHDTVRLSPDTVQCLTYRLCHMYYNLPGVIRVPAPCHYAHKLAYLVGQSIHEEPHHSLSNRLFYL